MSDNKRLIKTIFISGVAAIISYLINYFLTSYITENVGVDAYGFVSIAKTAVSYAQIITIALTNFTVRFISVSYHKSKMREANEYYSSSIAASIATSLGIFLLASAIIFNLERFLNIPAVLTTDVKILFIIVFINFVVTTIQTPFNAAAVIKNRLDIVNAMKIVSYCCDAGILLLMFKNFTPAVWFVGIGSMTATTVNFICNIIITHKFAPELKFNRTSISLGRVKKIVSHGIYNSINSLGNVLNSGLDLIVSNLLLSAVETGQIAVVKTIETIFNTMNATIFQALQPKLISSYSTGNMSNFLNQLKKSMKLCGYFTNLVFAGFFALGLLYYKLWLPGQDGGLLYKLTLLTALMYVTDGIMKPVYYVNTLTLKNKIPCLLTVACGLLNVISMYFLLKYTGLRAYAVVGTTTVIMISLNIIFHPLYAAWSLKISPRPLYVVLVRQLLSAIIMTLVFKLLAQIIRPSTWWGLTICTSIMIPCGLLIHIFITCNSWEKKQLISYISKKNERKK